MATGASLPFVCAWLGTNAFAQAIDRLSLHYPPATVRKWFLLPYAAAAAGIFFIPSAPTPTTTVVLLCAALTLFTSVTPIFAGSSLHLAPRFAGPLAAFQNAFANLAGIAAPVTIGYIVKSLGWSAAFFLTAAVATTGILAFFLSGSATTNHYATRSPAPHPSSN